MPDDCCCFLRSARKISASPPNSRRQAGRPAGRAASCNHPEDRIDSMSMNIERLKRITVEEGKCGGRPCIRGLRIRVSDVLDLLAAGASYEEILADYPFLEREDILAAIEYAARQADHIVLATS